MTFLARSMLTSSAASKPGDRQRLGGHHDVLAVLTAPRPEWQGLHEGSAIRIQGDDVVGQGIEVERAGSLTMGQLQPGLVTFNRWQVGGHDRLAVRRLDQDALGRGTVLQTEMAVVLRGDAEPARRAWLDRVPMKPQVMVDLAIVHHHLPIPGLFPRNPGCAPSPRIRARTPQSPPRPERDAARAPPRARRDSRTRSPATPRARSPAAAPPRA